MAKQKKTWKEKLQEDSPDFCASAESSSIEELNVKMLQMSKHAQEIEETLEKLTEEGSEVDRLRETIKEILGPSKDAKKLVGLKLRYIKSIIDDKGGQ